MSDMLNIGTSGLFASKQALETTGHNMANANTDGFSRQTVNQQTNPPLIRKGMVQGTGVRVVSITRSHDPFLEKRLNSNISRFNTFDERNMQLEQLENIFNEIDQEGLNKLLGRFYNSFRELANQPENETIRSIVRDNASLVTQDFHRISETLNEISLNINKKIEASLIDINSGSNSISRLNKKITVLEAAGDETGDLRDDRDRQIRALSEYFDVNYYEDEAGKMCVSAKNVGSLVAGGVVQPLAGGYTAGDGSHLDLGKYEVFYKNRSDGTFVTDKFKGGKLKALITLREGLIKKTKTSLNNIAYDFAQTVNAVHRRGFVNRYITEDSTGKPATKDVHGPTTGINFFAQIDSRENAAMKIQVSDEIRKNLTNIATALNINSPGDNRIAIAISKLQHEKILDNGQTTLEEKYLQTIGNVGLEAGKAKLDTEQSEGLLAMTKSLREKISGVSIDEEAANMLKYQHAYEASAKLMSTAGKMFDTVIGIMR